MTVTAHVRVTHYGIPVVVERYPAHVVTQPERFGRPVLLEVPGLGRYAVGAREDFGERAVDDAGRDYPCIGGDELLVSIYLDYVVLVIEGYPQLDRSD